MKILNCLLLILGCTGFIFGQFQQGSYTQYSLSTPMRANLDSNNEDEYWFTPNGLSFKFGEGLHFNRTIALGLNSGIDWIASRKLVVAPAFVNVKFSLKIDPETSFYIETAYGKSIILGRGNLQGDYKKIGLGIEGIEGIAIFAELTQYGFRLNSEDKVGNISVGLTFSSFRKNKKAKSIP